MSYENEMAQTQFLSFGGVLARAIGKKRETGEIAKEYIYREYPKILRISKGMQKFELSTKTVDKETIYWTEEKEIFEEIVVASEEEEDRVLSGGKTSSQIEEDRQNLIMRCRNAGILVDPSWSAVRLRRELGDKMDAPEASTPAQRLTALEAEAEGLRREAALIAEIAKLRAQNAQMALGQVPADDDVADLRQQLVALGVTPDKRWGAARLREELDRATEPDERAA